MQLTTILLLVSLCVLAHLQIALSQVNEPSLDLVARSPLFGIAERARRPKPSPSNDDEEPTPTEDPEEPAPTEDPTPSEDPKPDEEDPAPKPTRSPRRTRPAPSPSPTDTESDIDVPSVLEGCKKDVYIKDGPCDKSYRQSFKFLQASNSSCFKKVRRAGNPLNLFTVSIPKEECMCDPIRLYDACLGVNECDSGVAGLREIFDVCFIGRPAPKKHTKTTTTKNPKTKKPKTTTSVPETTELTVTTEQPKPISTEKKDPSLITPSAAIKGSGMGLGIVAGGILAVVVGAAF